LKCLKSQIGKFEICLKIESGHEIVVKKSLRRFRNRLINEGYFENFRFSRNTNGMNFKIENDTIIEFLRNFAQEFLFFFLSKFPRIIQFGLLFN
jgi:hypothetical protein